MRDAVCEKCGVSFLDASPTMPRKYCYDCAPRQYKPARPARTIVCEWCGSEFDTRGHGRPAYCSDACRRAVHRARYRESHPLGRPRAQKVITARYDMVCEACGENFVAKRRDARKCPSCRLRFTYKYKPRYCPDCGEPLPKKARNCPRCHVYRKGRFKVSAALRRRVYERDGWTCWICGLPVDESDDKSSGRLYPTLDHVIPRVRGGAHDESNLRCAHRSCNSSRGAA